MIEVRITEQMLHERVQKLGWAITYEERLDLSIRAILAEAGITVTFDFRPEKAARVSSGRLEWEYDHLRDVRVFRWYP